jgi:cation transport regulator ChaC
MTLHFAYGSNMSRPLMAARCPQARAVGVASLFDWRFIINADGLASIVRHKGSRVHGVLWRLSARDVAAINAYEDIGSGLYVSRLLPIQFAQRHASALVYLARRQGTGIPRPAYIQLVIAAALDWNLPQPYIGSIARWSPSRWRGARARETGELR